MSPIACFPRKNAIPDLWHEPCIITAIPPSDGGHTRGSGRPDMFNVHKLLSIGFAAFGAILLSSVSVSAAVGPIDTAPAAAILA